MELPNLGQHCAETTCKQLDFLPVKCDACEKTFCKDHMLYAQHNCEAAYTKNVQVPVCPLCNRPVPVKRGEPPDIKVGQHIDTDCQSDPAKQKRKIYVVKCSRRGCKQKEMINISCRACNKSFCLRHRHPQDHSCSSNSSNSAVKSNNNTQSLSKAGAAALSRFEATNSTVAASPNQHTSNTTSDEIFIQGNLSEDEALARALQMSLLDTHQATSSGTTQEEEDRRLAESLNAEEAARTNRTTRRGQRAGVCNVS